MQTQELVTAGLKNYKNIAIPTHEIFMSTALYSNIFTIFKTYNYKLLWCKSRDHLAGYERIEFGIRFKISCTNHDNR